MKKVLIIEDDQIVANIYRNKLLVEGYQVELASDGQAGLETLPRYQPDVVILDLMLPKLSGVDLLKKIRAEAALAKLPIIVFSNTYLSNMVQEAWKAGATKCLSKANSSPKQLIDIIRGTLGTNGATAKPASSPLCVSSPTASHPVNGTDADATFQAELRQTFLGSLPATQTLLRNLLQTIIKADSEVTRLKQIHEMYRRVHALTGNAAVAGLPHIAQVADALEALLKELYEKPKSINASTLRTVASAVDLLGLLFERGPQPQPVAEPPARVLVVDDEAISRRAVTYALEKAKLKSLSAEEPEAAYKLILEHRFDLVFVDVDMPGMNGFELCAKLRQLPAYKNTPVVFVTSLNDLESRANSTMSGGTDFIAKPFLFIELAVKALVFVLRGRLGARP